MLMVYHLPLQFQGPTIRETSPIVDDPGTVNIADTTHHEPITIASNQDFISQGWPGNGSQTYPYRLENLSISANGTCIGISNTNAFFVVTGCVLSAPDAPEEYPDAQCVSFSNVTNGVLMGSVVSARSRLESSYAVLFESSRYCSILDCQIDGRATCVRFRNSSECVLSGSLIDGSEESTVRLDETSDVRIISNQVWGGDEGIDVFESSGFEISNNEIWAYHRGVSFLRASYSTVANNSIRTYYGDGMSISNMTACYVVNNSVYDNHYGIMAFDSINCTFESNSIHDNMRGFAIWSGHSNTISKNLFWANDHGNAEDGGRGNIWIQNWWDDYIGYGWYPIEGDAGSYDTDPEPKNTAALVATTGSILLIVLGGLLIAAYVTRRARRAPPIEQGIANWEIKESLTLPLAFGMLLSSGVHLYLPAINPVRWSIWAISPMGVLSWTGQPHHLHPAIEFFLPAYLPATYNIELLLFYILFGFVWSILNGLVVLWFWYFAGGEINKSTMKRAITVVLYVMLIMSLVTLTIPLPVVPLATLLQVSRFKDAEGN